MKKKFNIGVFVEEILLLLCTAIILSPVIYMLLGAFKKRSDIVKHPFQLTKEMFILDNFPKAIKNMNFWKGLGNTALITVVSLLIVILVSSVAGFAVARAKGKLFTIFYGATVSIMVIPFISCLIPCITQATKFSIYNTLWGCIAYEAAWNIPMAVFLYTGFMRGLPNELQDAAYIDGCSTLQVYSAVFLPLLAPVTATTAIRCGVGMWNDYILAKCMLNHVKYPTLMVSIYAFFGDRVNEYGLAFAGIILASLPMIIIYIALQKYFIKGIVAGAVKG
ncbi:MAG: carbohydrate ABC transporter permease [Eubacteriales bacterium]|nr:carbohydrate ABC transporter permease [Eubacteriales bacterium]